VPLVLALGVTRLDFALTVPLVFAVAAATFCPLLVLGIWWRGLTPAGAIAGVLVGGCLSAVAVTMSLFAVVPQDWVGVLLYRPAVVTVPVAFLTMIAVSWFTRASIPRDVDRSLMILHAPEQIGLSRDGSDRPGHT
jgi:Na+(H+)/acetate symporter ActP